VSEQPTQTCQLCGDYIVVRDTGRGFPPDVAKKALRKSCKAKGCDCDPKYRAGIGAGLAEVLRQAAR
jgi:hypothetical protein